ncbi:Tn3 family transposase [Streptomyces sp. NPDC088757]|uniref:Tn3 family transposase n=1 Tax=Streptomyces sp. NPDC088757 TaxID=3365889 RepID=UPI00381C2BBC
MRTRPTALRTPCLLRRRAPAPAGTGTGPAVTVCRRHRLPACRSPATFALAHLLGSDLMPRIRNGKDPTLYRPTKRTGYMHIDALFGESGRNVIDFDSCHAEDSWRLLPDRVPWRRRRPPTRVPSPEGRYRQTIE